jgi:hypothetical protein
MAGGDTAGFCNRGEVLGSVPQTVGTNEERWLSAELFSVRCERRDARSAVMAELDRSMAAPRACSLPVSRAPVLSVARADGTPADSGTVCSPDAPVLGHAGPNLPPLLLLIFVERAQRQ